MLLRRALQKKGVVCSNDDGKDGDCGEVFDMLVTGYLFLGGTGAGSLAVLSALECANVRRRFVGGRAATLWIERACAFPDDFFARAWTICLIALTAGVLCLMLDVGRLDRLLNLLLFPTPSIMTIGVYALVVALACSGAFTVLELFDGVRIRPHAMYTLSAVGIAAGVAAMMYAGMLLQGLASVLFWRTPVLTALFFLSALSCGIASAFLAAAFAESRDSLARSFVRLARFDGVVVLGESLCLAIYLAWALAGDGTVLPARALVMGDLRFPFWAGAVMCGLVAPFVLERMLARASGSSHLVCIALLLLAGGFALRFCMVSAASYDATQMPGGLFGLGAG